MSSHPGSTQTHGLPDDTRIIPDYSNAPEPSKSQTELSSKEVEEDVTSQGSKVPSQPAEGGLGPHEEPETATVKGFTKADCFALYHKAIKGNPTITLHVAKAMTIGPPQVGKTALRHHLLELPPPEVGSSTPVMKTAETVSVCPSDSATSPGEVGDVPPSGADINIENLSDSEDASSSDESDDSVGQVVAERSRYENRMYLVAKHKWVPVNNDSGILSLLKHLRKTIAVQSSIVQQPVDCETAAQGIILASAPEMATEDNILPNLNGTVDENIILPSTHEDVHHETSQPLDDKSNSVAIMSSRIYRELQNPDIADIALPDAHLLQFLDCGGQLAYHDILPLFVNIPAIYLNVFNITEELTECPIDELCSTEGNKIYSGKSALSVAEMITRSVMTVRSLADRKVQLLPDVPCENKPRIILVGTHLDKLVENDECEKLKAANEILQKALQSKSRLLERVVVSNEKSQLMFFPVNNKLYVDKSHQLRKRCKCKHCRATKNLKGRITKQAMEDAVKVEVPVRWYLHQLLELSRSEKPLYSYSELYQHCKKEESVTDLGEFHAMVTYFHAVGLLIHLCGADIEHTEESVCQVFTNPSFLFENISRLYQVQFFEDVRGGDKSLLKHEGKLTRDALRDLGIQLNPDLFMDLLVQLFIGAEIKSREGDRVLFVPSVLTNSSDDASPSGVSTGPQEYSLCFAVTFESKSFIPCGVFTGMSARLQRAEGWEISTDFICRRQMVFAVGPVGIVTLLNHATHISVSMDRHEGQCQEYRDTVIEAAADSYCFLFHSKSAKDPQSGPCSECTKSPYLVLGQTCQECPTLCDTPEAPHFAELKVQNHSAVSVRCQMKQTAKQLSRSECDLFQNMSHYAVVNTQYTGCTLEGEGSGEIPPSQTGSKTPSSPHPSNPICSDPVSPEPKRRRLNPTDYSQTGTSTVDSGKDGILSQTVTDHPDHLILYRKYVSRQAAKKSRAVLEGVGLHTEAIDACFSSHPLDDEGAVQEGLTRWSSGQSYKLPTWEVLLDAMEHAQIAQVHVQGLKRKLGLLGSKTPSTPTGTQQTIPQSKKKQTTSTGNQFLASEFLMKHEIEFFSIINARFSLRRLKRLGVITQDVMSHINAATNDEDAQEILYEHLMQHATVDTLMKYCEVATAAEGYPKMQSFGRRMKEELEQKGSRPTDGDHSNS